MRKWMVCLLVLAVLMLAVTAIAEEPQREVITSGDWQYVVLDDGTVEIVKYTGEAETLAIPNTLDGKSVTSIGDNAFHSCSNLTSITLPNSLTSIGDDAFYSCSNLTSITLPDGVTSIGSNPFQFCSKLSSIHVSPDHNYLAVIDGVLFSKPDKRLVCYPEGKTSTAYEIPKGIRIIGDNAFYSYSSLTNIVLPDSVTSIGRTAFIFCTSLTNITLPDSVMRVGENPFLYCEKLSQIHVSPDHNYLAVIDGVLFSKPDKRLVCYPQSKTNTAYEIPRGISIIGDSAFFDCSSLTNITLPDSVTSIGDCAFILCGLTSITLPDNVMSIGDWAFCSCGSLTNITLPDSLTSIGDDAFSGCENLTLTVSRESYAAQYCKENNLNYTYPDANDWLTAP